MEEKITFEDFSEVGNDILFSAFNRNGIYRYKKNKEELKCVKLFENYDISMMRLFGCQSVLNNKVYFAPFVSNEFYEYDNLSDTIRNITPSEQIYCPGESYTISFSTDESVYFVGFNCPYILRYVPRNDIWSKIVVNEQALNVTNPNKVYFIKGYVRIGDFVYIPFGRSNVIIRLSTKDDSYEVINIGEGSYCYSDLAFDENRKLYLAPALFNQPIVSYDIHTGEVKEYKYESPYEMKAWNSSYFNWRIIAEYDKVWLFPITPGNFQGRPFVIKYDIAIQSSKVIWIEDDKDEKRSCISSWLVRKCGKNIIFSDVSALGNRMYCLSMENDEIEEMGFRLDGKDVWALSAMIDLKGNRVLNETKKRSLLYFMEEVKKENMFDDYINLMEG